MNAAPMLSVHWNQFLGRYLAVYSTPLVNTIEFRTAERPEGPWSASQKIITGRPPAGNNWDYCGMAHSELSRGHGRTEYVTYCRDIGSLLTEIRAVEVTFR
jgi:hypothetical protein